MIPRSPWRPRHKIISKSLFFAYIPTEQYAINQFYIYKVPKIAYSLNNRVTGNKEGKILIFVLPLYLLAVDTKKSLEASSQNHIKKPLSCDPALSVFDGITVKVHYIGDEQQAVGNNSSETNSTGKAATLSKNGVINSSKELLLGLEEKRKKEVTTVPLRQPLCANYKSIVTSTTRQNSFMGKKLRNFSSTGKTVPEALILESVNPQYDERLFIEFPGK